MCELSDTTPPALRKKDPPHPRARPLHRSIRRTQFYSTLLLAVGTAIASGNAASAPSSKDSGPDDPWAEIEEMVVFGSQDGFVDLKTTSATSFDAETLGALGIEDISDLSAFTPNLEIVTAGTSSPTLFIRGVGLNDFSPIATPAISVYEDGVPRNASAIMLGRIYDVEAVAIYRGPQGTGPFRNASAGSIKILSRKPSGEFSASLSASYGNYGYVDIEGAVEAPIVQDLLAIRVAFGFTDREGWLRNRCGGAPPLSERIPRVGSNAVGPSSICGEEVERNEVSPIPVGLPDNINAEQDFAARSIISFTPDLALETEWFLNLHGERRRDDSTLGQSIGAGLLFDRSPNVPGGELVPAGSGGYDPFRYRDADITARSDAILEALLAQCGAACVGPGSQEARRTANFERNRRLGKSLEGLDDEPFVGAFNHVGATHKDVFGTSITGTVELGRSVVFKTITGYETWERLFDLDLDMTPNTAFHLRTKDKGYQLSQEVELAGASEELALPISWSAGGLVLFENVDVDVKNNFGDNSRFSVGRRIYTQKLLSMSAYLEAELELSETFSIVAGARYNVERKELDYSLERTGRSVAAHRTTTWDAPTGLLQFNYRPTEDLTFFAKYTRGWKAGTFNATGNVNRGIFAADPESIDSYEVGMDLQAVEGLLELTANLFFYDYKNYQIFIGDNNYGSVPELVTINAGNAQNYGAEIEAILRPFEGAQYEVRLGWLESEFIDFTQQQLQQGQVGREQFLSVTDIDYSGNRLLNSPQYSLSIIASQDFDLGRVGTLTLRYSGTWKDDVYFDASEGTGVTDEQGRARLSEFTIGQKAYWLHGMGVDWRPLRDGIRVSGWVRNLTNEAYKTFSLDFNSFQRTTVNFVGTPRTYGMTVALDW